MTAYFEAPPVVVPVELGPVIVPLAPGEVVPLAPGDVVELCGCVLLPDELLGPQSFIALLSFIASLPLLVLGLVVPLLLAPGLLAVEALLPGGQSRLDRLPDVPDVAPVVALLPVVPDDVPLAPALVCDLLVPVVLLVCAIAAVPKVIATIEAAVTRSRFIRVPPCEMQGPAGQEAIGALYG
jgi:hypothetical protein